MPTILPLGYQYFCSVYVTEETDREAIGQPISTVSRTSSTSATLPGHTKVYYSELLVSVYQYPVRIYRAQLSPKWSSEMQDKYMVVMKVGKPTERLTASPMKLLAREWFTHIEHRFLLLLQSSSTAAFKPRCLLSPMDIGFCAQFIKVMRTQETPGFPSSVVVYDKVLGTA
ncbi:hypothetical protein C8R48DRAFT_672384 [Suillus tomentosus]|nr:hypothetical protein C8R48DRAFT_672384 [Suillus tomentosus]